jgi:Anti-sigma-K factor rskA
VPHLDPDRLALLALSESSADPGESTHLVDCAACRHDLDALQHVVRLATDGDDLRDLPAPPPRVWQAIQADVARLNEPPVTEPGTDTVVHRNGTTSRRRQRPERRWRAPVLSAAAAAIIAVAGTVTVIEVLQRQPDTKTIASASLKPLPSVPAAAHGTARVLADDEMQIDVRNLPLTTGFHEVWLIDPEDTKRMVALGNLTDKADAVLPIPPGTDLNQYRLVDISDEPHDGDAAHSGHSLLRGVLTS